VLVVGSTTPGISMPHSPDDESHPRSIAD